MMWQIWVKEENAAALEAASCKGAKNKIYGDILANEMMEEFGEPVKVVEIEIDDFRKEEEEEENEYCCSVLSGDGHLQSNVDECSLISGTHKTSKTNKK